MHVSCNHDVVFSSYIIIQGTGILDSEVSLIFSAPNKQKGVYERQVLWYQWPFTKLSPLI